MITKILVNAVQWCFFLQHYTYKHTSLTFLCVAKPQKFSKVSLIKQILDVLLKRPLWTISLPPSKISLVLFLYLLPLLFHVNCSSELDNCMPRITACPHSSRGFVMSDFLQEFSILSNFVAQESTNYLILASTLLVSVGIAYFCTFSSYFWLALE